MFHVSETVFLSKKKELAKVIFNFLSSLKFYISPITFFFNAYFYLLERQREIFHLLVYSPNTSHSLGLRHAEARNT